jgi:hypothetical protein
MDHSWSAGIRTAPMARIATLRRRPALIAWDARQVRPSNAIVTRKPSGTRSP